MAFAAGVLAVMTAHSNALMAQAAPAQPAVPMVTAIPPQALLQPAELVKLMGKQEKMIILQVGSHVLFAEAHIPGSEYAGPGNTPAGLQVLRDRVARLPKDQPIVIYCGCCPWDRCPNIRPAYMQLQSLGFTKVKALYIADNFGADWVDKDYPVAKGR
jgi:rhodanese-related sulfurtransferase